MRVVHVQEIAAPVDEVWDLTMDVEAWPSFTPTMTRIERLDDTPIQVGSAVRIKQPGQPERTWTVSELEPMRRFAWSTKTLGVTMTGMHEVEASPEGTSNTLTVALDGPLATLLGPLLKRPIHKALAQENAGFKTAAER